MNIHLQVTACALASLAAGGAWAQAAPPSRGALLYETHCIACHTEQMHWRAKRAATDWTSLKTQVRRWQGNTGLGWSDDDIDAVARHLNDRHYRFAITARPQG